MNYSDAKYTLQDNGDFIITNYNSAKPFSSFFPGIAGKDGIPMWVFYVNRGQCVCSMGIEDKQSPIMEFLPANWAYQLAANQGFRTFIQFTDSQPIDYYEPFQDYIKDNQLKREQRMIISPSQLILEEINYSLNLKFSVKYFNVPQDRYAGLIRILSITNMGDQQFCMKGLDGLPLIIPHGVDNLMLKNMRRLVEAFVEVVNYENNVPFFRGKVKPEDRPEVVKIQEGNFYCAFESDQQLIPTIYDPQNIFGWRTNYSYPENFIHHSEDEILSHQIYENRLPCAMGLFNAVIDAGSTYSLSSIIGFAHSTDEINALIPTITTNQYLKEKEKEDKLLIDELTQHHCVFSQDKALDYYVKQNFLDNTLRGGFPYTLKDGNRYETLYLYSRKHGDLERDYNDFRLSPTHYSQGNGNYRDINQNRRCDLMINPNIAENNLEHFYNLIQMDGFNPLVIKVTSFHIKEPDNLNTILKKYIEDRYIQTVRDFLNNSYTPGSLLEFFNAQHIKLNGQVESLLLDLFEISGKTNETDHGEGFWTDHWTYNLDLLENYLTIYPENYQYILLEKKSFTFYDNAHCVQPRKDKYVLWEGKAMQLNAVVLDYQKNEIINSRKNYPNAVRKENGQGDIYYTNLFNKLLSLITNKISSLDPEGVGVEMESEKPNWYDALNGLPGLIGSSISETFEIKRTILFLLQAFEQKKLSNESWSICTEIYAFIKTIQELCMGHLSSYDFWEAATTARENFRQTTRLGISGKEVEISIDEVKTYFDLCLKKLNQGIEKAWRSDRNILSTYFINQVESYKIIEVPTSNNTSQVKRNQKGLPCFQAKEFKQIHLPLFLEGPVHYLRCKPEKKLAQKLFQDIKQSGLFDKELNMYKVNESISDQPMEIGRNRVFTPGWFENESIWLHMEYKYMLELLRNELYDEFYSDFKKVFIPYLKPEVYGRSILENSSFLVCSANPDPSIHGNGFVARLTGATAEFVHIIQLMTAGQKPFDLNQNQELTFKLRPSLKNWLFTKQKKKIQLYTNNNCQEIVLPANTFSFMFLGKILVTYHNPEMKDTFGSNGVQPTRYTLTDSNLETSSISSKILDGDIVKKIRKRKIQRMDIELS